MKIIYQKNGYSIVRIENKYFIISKGGNIIREVDIFNPSTMPEIFPTLCNKA